ncbi:MAG: hypothetical protein JO254_03190 [Pseudolabrys sp.]|nr:hypothetical protein [Pseudolabrys sp.]
MSKTILAAVLSCALALPAFAAGYPVQGRWGESKSADKGPVDCSKLRVIAFNGEERTDTGGGVPAYRNLSVTPDGGGYKITDIFTTGQIRNGRTTYTLVKTDTDRIELRQQVGGTLKLQRCK